MNKTFLITFSILIVLIHTVNSCYITKFVFLFFGENFNFLLNLDSIKLPLGRKET